MKTALVTGGTHGIGLATALALKEQGFRVAVAARGINGQDSLGCGLVFCRADLSKPQGTEDLLYWLRGIHFSPDILINNVGGSGRWGKDGITLSEEDWQASYEQNAGAARRLTLEFIPQMIQRGWGRVVTIASIYGRESGGPPWFDMAKSAQIAMMKSLSRNPLLVRHGITFNTVAPGRIAVGGKEDDLTPEVLARDYPMGKVGEPEDVANLIAFLCSDKAKHINGACITVDGGESRSF